MIPLQRIVLVIVGLLLFGAARLHFEQALTGEYRAAHFMQSQLNRNVRIQAGQMGFIAALSGLRAAVADIMWIEAHDAWQNTNWGKMKARLDAATELQPRSLLFWDGAGWHMAWNASVSALQNRNQPREALRQKAAKQYIALGEDYLQRGLAYNSDHAQLWESLGRLYEQKMNDPCKAAWAYFEAAARPDAHQYVYRAAIYQLEHCPGHEAESLKLALEVYHLGPRERAPHLLKLIDELQIKLNVPPEQRIDITEDMKEAMPHIPPAPAPK